MKTKYFKIHATLAALLLLTAAFAPAACSSSSPTLSVASTQTPAATKAPASAVPPIDFKNAIAQVAKENIPSVVHIEVTQREEIENPLNSFGNSPFFNFFFNAPNMPHKFKRELKGLGTGMIIDKQGHILTNYHVAGGATEIQVALADGRHYPAKLVGADPKTDLAVIQIKADHDLPVVTFGDSDQLTVGDWVVAIGQPRGLDETVTQGIISAKHRSGIIDPSGYQDFLQTDAAINPGNSGGPLINLQGQVIGVNAAIASDSGGFEGIGFAIPSNMAVHIAQQLIANGKVERGWLGVSISDLSPEKAGSLGLKTNHGALVQDVAKGGPAEAAGIHKGDLITAYRGQAVTDSSMLRNQVAATPIGTEAALSILRNGATQDLRVKIGDLQEIERRMVADLKKRLGIEVRPVTQKEAEHYGIDTSEGVAIKDVVPNGPLAQVGFEKADLILAVNGGAVAGVDDFATRVAETPPHTQLNLLALDHRSGQTGSVDVMTN